MPRMAFGPGTRAYDRRASLQVAYSATPGLSPAIPLSGEVTMFATSNCWVYVREPGQATPTAAPNQVGSLLLQAGEKWSEQVPDGCTISVVQDTAAGVLSILFTTAGSAR